VRGLSCLIVDDEADQASLNTRASKDDGTRSTINDRITELRGFFEKNTYLQVTATPYALFLQKPGHSFRPKFTVLSHPGQNYVGGEDFFAEGSKLVKEFDLNDITVIAPGPQPNPTLEIPASLLRALDTFVIGATYKRSKEADQNCAFLCHVSTRKNDHGHIVDLLLNYKTNLARDLAASKPSIINRLKAAFDDLASTHDDLKNASFDELLATVQFFARGISVKLVNGDTDEDVAVKSPLNLFVGGNKLGRGVTIKNLLVSYYGRHPRSPQADTVLQHARMYGYRRSDIGLLRLFLPRQLHVVFKAINKMEQTLRDLIGQNPTEEFRGIFVETGLSATRKNVLAPGSVGIYTGGSNYNPAQVLRDASTKTNTEKLDAKLSRLLNKGTKEVSIEEIQELIRLAVPDPERAEHVWNSVAVAESVGQFAKLHNDRTGFLFVDRDRELDADRRETQGILSGGEASVLPPDRIGLFMLRTKASNGKLASWWPQIRFPNGRYAFAFAV
jgi:hypothetical protein